MPGQIGERGTACQQDNAAVPICLKVGALDDLGRRLPGILHQDILGADLPGDHKGLVAALDDRGHRQPAQTAPGLVDRACLELEILGASQDLGDAHEASAELMRNLCRVSRDLMKAQKQRQTL